ncbi:MAG: hypothetical protein IKN43_04380, partial [Selenomonadaceae bacterium]|nr:hypothetical protein [Selenomonadaceae bacterium]
NVNEIQYILYQYLKKYNVPYMLVGEQWKILGMDTYLQEKNKRILKCDDSETCNIFADDETVRSINDMRYYYREDYLFEKYHELSTRLALCNYINEVEIVSKYLNRYGVATACVRFPDAAELGQTENEAWCFHNQVSLNFFRKQCDFKYIHNILETYGEKLVGQYKRGVTQVGRFMEVVNECNLQYVNDEKRNKIILVGPCVVRQEELMTEDTLVSRLQSKMDEAGYPYRVEGLTIPIEKYHRMKSALQTMYFYKGDIVIFCNMYLEQEFANYYLDLLPLFQSNRGERWFTDTSIHLNQIGTERVAERIADLVSNINGENICNNTITLYPKKISLEKEQWINSWVKQWKNNELNMNGTTIGAIVMNCNPYTKGHDYLIRYAASHVDFLYIFVVEEDVSLFSFDIRYELVRKNTADLNNVGVIPSGKAVLSMQTLPTYFSKGSVCDVTVDASNDLTTFAIGIAPRFGITKRFVGTEPNDSVTAQYNEQMKQILQHYGIEVVEIPRLEIGGEVISATTARNAMKDGNINILQKMLTDISFSEIMRES